MRNRGRQPWRVSQPGSLPGLLGVRLVDQDEVMRSGGHGRSGRPGSSARPRTGRTPATITARPPVPGAGPDRMPDVPGVWQAWTAG
ncbi:MAG TPA: hypothetical protein DHU96_01305 [Actinobacteria bacterium]|nr:hypothetical protein [Actinomycetota bacterium]